MSETSHATGEECSTFIESEKREERSFHNPGFAQDDRHPVVCVSWHDAKAFVAWLSKKTGKPYRLLTEAEREYAARAGTTTPFWWGAAISTAQANYSPSIHYKPTYGGGPKGEWRKKTVAVDSFEANPWGLYNVHGNVFEWVEDCYKDSYLGSPTDGSAVTSEDCNKRVLRGGDWNSPPWFLRSAHRTGSLPRGRTIYFGFRLARTLAPQVVKSRSIDFGE